MQTILAALRDAEWLNGRRARVYPRLLLAASLGLALIWIVAARGGVDLAGKPLGTDFLSFFTASALALHGRAA
jgi:alpha-1,2-mannosyltransferase